MLASAPKPANDVLPGGLPASGALPPNMNGDPGGLFASEVAPNAKGPDVGAAGLLSDDWPNPKGLLVSLLDPPNPNGPGLELSFAPPPKTNVEGVGVAAGAPNRGFEVSVVVVVEEPPNMKGVDEAEPNDGADVGASGFGAPKPVKDEPNAGVGILGTGPRSGDSSILISPESACGGVFGPGAFAGSAFFSAGAGVPKPNSLGASAVAGVVSAGLPNPVKENGVGALLVLAGMVNEPKADFGASSFFSAAGAGTALGNENEGLSDDVDAVEEAGGNENRLGLLLSPFVAGAGKLNIDFGASVAASFFSAVDGVTPSLADNESSFGTSPPLVPKSGTLFTDGIVTGGALAKNVGKVVSTVFFPSMGLSMSGFGCEDENEEEKIDAGMDWDFPCSNGDATPLAEDGGMAKKLLAGAAGAAEAAAGAGVGAG